MATSTTIFDLTALGAAPATADVLVLVDVSDPSQSSQGSTKKMTVANLFASPTLVTPTITAQATVAGGTVTTSVPPVVVTQTWNALAIAFTAMQINVTDTSSAPTSAFADFQIAGVSKFSVSKAGAISAAAGITLGGSASLVAVTASGEITATAGLRITGATGAAQGAIYKDGTAGMLIEGIAGSASDVTVQNKNALTVFSVPTGTQNLSIAGTVILTATLSKIVPGVTSLSCRNNADSADNLLIADAGSITVRAGITHGATTLLTTSVALTNGAAFSTATLTNAPTNGNPTKWVPINDNGTTRYIPAW